MSLARPWLLLLLLALPWWVWRRRKRGPSGAAYSDVSLVAPAAGRSWILAVPPGLRLLALAAWIIAAAGPRSGGSTIEQKKEGIAIVVAIDISSSMLAEDFAPSNRLEVAKAQAVSFIRARSADRIGVVVFAGEALTQVPLTVDYPVLERAVMDLRIGMLEDGTAIGSGLATALNRLRRAPDKSKVVLLLTDGENNRGTIDPRTAAAAAAALGVKVYTIGVGTEGEAPIPTGRGVTGFRYEILPVRIDEKLLQDIGHDDGRAVLPGQGQRGPEPDLPPDRPAGEDPDTHHPLHPLRGNGPAVHHRGPAGPRSGTAPGCHGRAEDPVTFDSTLLLGLAPVLRTGGGVHRLALPGPADEPRRRVERRGPGQGPGLWRHGAVRRGICRARRRGGAGGAPRRGD